MSNHFTLSMSVKVLVVSFKILTVLSSVDDDWFIHPHWGELELDATSWNTTSPGSKVVGSIFRKSLRLSGRARNEHSVGQITTMISSDATYLDLYSGIAHQSVLYFGPWFYIIGPNTCRWDSIWASPIQVDSIWWHADW